MVRRDKSCQNASERDDGSNCAAEKKAGVDAHDFQFLYWIPMMIIMK